MAIDRQKQLDAIFRILLLVQREPGWGPKELAAHLGVVERTFHRYRQTMERAGMALVFDPRRRGYRMQDGVFLPPVQLRAEEALALAAIVRASPTGPDAALDGAVNAVRKVLAALPPDLLDEVEANLDRVEVRPAPAMEEDGAKRLLEHVRFAIRTLTALDCRYESNRPDRDGEDSFLFEPYRLFYSRRAWYVVGRRSDREGLRNLKVSRFLAADPTERPFSIPEGFSLAAYLGNAWELINGTPEHDVVLRITHPQFATNAEETRWHATQETEHHDDGTITLRFRVAGLDEIEWWVLSWGEHCEVVAPRELAERIRGHAERMVAVADRTLARRGGGAGGKKPTPRQAPAGSTTARKSMTPGKSAAATKGTTGKTSSAATKRRPAKKSAATTSTRSAVKGATAKNPAAKNPAAMKSAAKKSATKKSATKGTSAPARKTTASARTKRSSSSPPARRGG